MRELRRCKSCTFWEVYREKGSIGYCRRYPPKLVRPLGDWEEIDVQEEKMGYAQPATWDEDWCGEYVAK